MKIINEQINNCPICNSEETELLIEENNYIYCSNCKWTFLPQSTWTIEEIIERFKRQ